MINSIAYNRSSLCFYLVRARLTSGAADNSQAQSASFQSAPLTDAAAAAFVVAVVVVVVGQTLASV